ncbi:MAG: ribosomal subunit interface protein [Candidatus Portnoybacteria bacterium RBG_13_41_18]|uniref:Ribosomal subunit interface protein n=1 Tax=Candidatus Portnoybacteria bacterium RBG_13_41_18 TaxID=1801991 RepID=A0A1G2F5K1_9BACT|nr:MAG: ribosomal subunit interface protein [Candidatus Portnoybacteria bacterium RBG_13_41_18]
MKFIIKSKEIEIPDGLDAYIEKRIGKLDKFLESVDKNLIEATVEIGKVSGRHKQGKIYQLNVNLKFPGNFFRSEVQSEDLYSAVDEAKEELELEIRKFKQKKETKFIRGARSAKKSLRISPMARFRIK